MTYLENHERTRLLGRMIKILYHLEKKGKDTIRNMEKVLLIPKSLLYNDLTNLVNKYKLVKNTNLELPLGITSRTLIYELTEEGKKAIPKLRKLEKKELKESVQEILSPLEKIFPLYWPQ